MVVVLYMEFSLLLYSKQSDKTAAQKIYYKHDHRRYCTPRYQQAVRDNVEVVAKYNVHQQPTASTKQRELQWRLTESLLAGYTGALWYLLRLSYTQNN